jgi:hypothetical protein
MTTKYFNGETELTAVTGMDNREFAAKFPGVTGLKWDSFSKLVGVTAGMRWADAIPVDRKVNYGGKNGLPPSKHECDARCMYARGRTMNCECSCGGKNHGRGASFNCQ